MFYLDKFFCVMSIYNRGYVCDSECDVVSDECDNPTSAFMWSVCPPHHHVLGTFLVFGGFCELCFLNYNYVILIVVYEVF